MKISIHQPAYLPWLGLLEKIRHSDIYVYLDDVQFEKRSFISRNKIKTPSGPQWLSIPVHSKGHRETTMLTMTMDEVETWSDKHLKSILHNYNKSDFFSERYPLLVDFFCAHKHQQGLTDFLLCFLQFWCKELDIKTEIVKQSDLGIKSYKSDLIYDICSELGADEYYSGRLGSDYLDEEKFSESGILIEYQDYVEAPYHQLWGEFVPYLSVLDHWFNKSKINIGE